jgi:hypothetical protein
MDWSDLPRAAGADTTRLYRVARCRDELATFTVGVDMDVDYVRRVIVACNPTQQRGLSAWTSPAAAALRVHSREDLEEDDDLLALHRPIAELFEHWRLFSCPQSAFADAYASASASASADTDAETVPGWAFSAAADGHALLYPTRDCELCNVYHTRGCTTAVAARVHARRDMWAYHGVVTRWLSPTRMSRYLQSDAVVSTPQARAVLRLFYTFQGAAGGFVYESLYELLQDSCGDDDGNDGDDDKTLAMIAATPHFAARLARAQSSM